MSTNCVVDLSNDKMRLLSRRPSPRLLAVPLLLVAFFSLVGLTDWIDWNANKNCPPIKTIENSTNHALIRRATDWWTASDHAYAKLLKDPAYSQAGTCRSSAASRADIDTVDVYPTLNFQVGIDLPRTRE